MTTTEEKTESRADPGLVEITIDGRAYQAPKGGNLLQLMLEQGIEISYFCYHPGLSVVAVCRQCLVALKNSSKLVPACQTLIAEGMEIDNSSERVLDARRQMLEFQLVDHPIDCPICDKAGECILQKHYMDWDHQHSRIDHEKEHKPKRVRVGPRVMLDDERCILCTRCVRFMAEVVGDPQLVIAHRGSHATLTTAPGRQLDNPYSLNVVDICPVGALTDVDFRFKIRVWELSRTLSVCNGCATGCPIEVHHHRDRVHRLVSRRYKRSDISESWLCDFGRYTYKAIAADRLLLPTIKGEEASWDDALGHVAQRLQQAIDKDRKAIGVVLGADATNEDNFVAARLAFDYIEADQIYLATEPDGTAGDDFLRSNDPNPNRAGALACAGPERSRTAKQLADDLLEDRLKALIVVGDKLHLPDDALTHAARLTLFTVLATHPSTVTAKAHVVLPAASWAEVDGTITNRQGKTQRMRAAVTPPDFARPHWQILCQLARRAGLTLDFPSAREIFEAMQAQIKTFAGARWGKDLPADLLRFAGSRG